MTLVPSHQFYPSTTTFIDSFQNPVYGTARLKLIRYNSLPLFHAHESFSTCPNSKPSSGFKKREIRRGFSVKGPIFNSNVNWNSSRSSWLEKCNDKHLKIRPKPHQAVVKCRKDLSLSSMRVNSRSGGGSGDGGGGGSTMEKIVEKLKKFGYMDDMNDRKEERRVIEKGSIEDIFYVEEDMMPNRRGGFSEESPLGVDSLFGSKGEVRFPWEKGAPKDEDKRNSVRERSRTSLAELTLPESELKRLRSLALRLKTRTRIKGGGLTNEIVDIIHEKWKSSEVVRLKIEGASALNMKKMHEILERKTNGLVIWRSGTAICLYRGVSYEDPSTKASKRAHKKNEIATNSLSLTTDNRNVNSSERDPDTAAIARQGDLGETLEVRTRKESSHETEYEDEVDKLLDELGPRYSDWPGDEPLPVDADLLPGTVPGYRPPFRVLPYGVRGTLSVKEATALRRVARVLPPHFALGRSRQHEGLAVAMSKLWERSSIAKVALKRGVQLTTSERMAEDIKNLTGGMLLSTNKDYLVFYRGKDFLTPEVAEALLEKERLGKDLQDEEEHARLRASSFVIPDMEIHENSQTTGTLKETLNADARWGKILDENHKSKVMREAEFQRYADLIRKLENKLAFAERRVMKAERTLSKVEESLAPLSLQADPDSITDEERFMFRKLGLRMKAFLLLGRRGVFGGTVENMHLHWKYRELVKIIVKAKDFEEVKTTALSLEAESGGVLVSVDKVSKGYAIIVFRGKDYSRPSLLRPKNLLTKRKALARSIELQRREALLKHIATLQARTNQLRSEIEQMASLKESGNEELFEKIDSAYSSADEESEDEVLEAFLENGDEKDDADEENGDEDDDDDANEEYDSEDTEDDNDEADQSLHSLHLDTNFPYNFQDYESEPQASSNLQ